LGHYAGAETGDVFQSADGFDPESAGRYFAATGDSKRGFGAGTTQFELFAAFDQLFKENTFLQTQLGADLPVDTRVAPRSMFWRAAVGQAMAPDHMLGRLFSPMVEFLAVRDFKPGASTNWMFCRRCRSP